MNQILKIATPLTTGAFLLMAVTGVLLFFKLDTGLNKEAHEWLSWTFLTGVGVHIVRNFKSFQKHLGSKAGLLIVGVFATILTATFFITPDEGGKPPMREIMQGLSQAPLETVASVAAVTPEELTARLEKKGFTVDSTSQTLKQVAGDDQERSMQALGAAFGQ